MEPKPLRFPSKESVLGQHFQKGKEELQTLALHLTQRLAKGEAKDLVAGLETWFNQPFLSPYPQRKQYRDRPEGAKKADHKAKRKAKQLPTREAYEKQQKEKAEKEEEPQPLHKN